eukprot:1161712-Pelagomonas_calceolata.AAC.9
MQLARAKLCRAAQFKLRGVRDERHPECPSHLMSISEFHLCPQAHKKRGTKSCIAHYNRLHVGLESMQFKHHYAHVTPPKSLQQSSHVHVRSQPAEPELSPLQIQELIEADEPLRIDEAYEGVDYSAPLLPPFLELSDELQPVNIKQGQSFKAAGMRCASLLCCCPPSRKHPHNN